MVINHKSKTVNKAGEEGIERGQKLLVPDLCQFSVLFLPELFEESSNIPSLGISLCEPVLDAVVNGFVYGHNFGKWQVWNSSQFHSLSKPPSATILSLIYIKALKFDHSIYGIHCL